MDLGKMDGLPDFIDKSITKEEYESKIISKTEEENRNGWENIPSFQEHAVFAGTQYRYFDTEGNVFLDLLMWKQVKIHIRKEKRERIKNLPLKQKSILK